MLRPWIRRAKVGFFFLVLSTQTLGAVMKIWLLIHRRNRPSYTRDHTLESWLIVCTQGTASKAGRIWTGLSRFETHPCGFALDAAIAPLPPARFSRHRSPPHPPLAHFLYNR